ncbi:kinase-like domain-containing protein [Rhizophagus clarus]|uniref:Kinase-like domain-containing protein n=1 Tax=Rhizophagus clarus TaxID=94130 RepID=A0A8H3MD92_9GLOM|nr:kinase-like domain-containing protein [Rhizophagus clarus]
MPKNLWKILDYEKYEDYITFSSIDSIFEQEIDERIVYIEDLKKRKQAYGICGECNEPGTGEYWCQSCNAKRFKDNLKNWTSGNEIIDEFMQQSQLNAVHHTKYFEWIPFENFRNVTHTSSDGYGNFYSAEWPNGCINSWNIENQKYERSTNCKVALKSLYSDIRADFFNKIKSHLQIHSFDIIQCFGLTQDPGTRDYMMVLEYRDVSFRYS